MLARVRGSNAARRRRGKCSGALSGALSLALLAAVASGQEHWAFQPPVRPPLPEVSDGGPARNAIDRFVLARLRAEGLEPSPAADPETLVRRLHLDLWGLPPDPADVAAFVADPAPDAYERLVDRLCDSPHFAERWARHWLDLARYADSDGYEKDTERPNAWRWRDWVIDAIDADLPFDRFVIEQLAGDMLPDATEARKVATGFHRNTLTNKEGGVDEEEFRVKALVDRVDTTGSALLGLTLGCAQCHDHKYDPLKQREYYELLAFYNDADEVDIPVQPTAAERAAYEQALADHEQERARLRQQIDAREPELLRRLRVWEQDRAAGGGAWHGLEPRSFRSDGGAKIERLDDGSLRVGGANPARDRVTVVAGADVGLAGITAFRLEVLVDPDVKGPGPGRTRHGNFVLSELEVFENAVGEGVADDGFVDAGVLHAHVVEPDAIRFALAHATFSQKDYPVGHAIDGDRKTGWAVQPRFRRSHVAIFTCGQPVDLEPGGELTFRLLQEYGSQHTIGRFRLSARTGPVPESVIDPEVEAVLAVPAARRSETEWRTLLDYFASIDEETKPIAEALARHEGKKPKEPRPRAMTIAWHDEPRQTHVLERGDFLRPGDAVEPGTPAVLPPLEARGARPDRLDLARWIVDGKNPLAARVAVNRVWMHLFGRGLVRTPDDFGTRGERPTHPELLDWLACEFQARGQSRKELIRLIVRSATYRQTSRTRAELRERDPDNRLLARQSRFRVAAEIVRDLCLSVGGLLNPAVGGPSVRPPLPDGVADLGYAGSVRWPESEGAARYRRGLYIHFQRTVPYPMLVTFDAPDSTVSCTRRNRSNSPLQALTTLNDPVFVECAQALAREVLRAECRIDAERVDWLFRRCLGRAPEERERARVLELLLREHELCDGRPEACESIAGAYALPECDPARQAAWVAVARAMLNLDEFLTRG